MIDRRTARMILCSVWSNSPTRLVGVDEVDTLSGCVLEDLRIAVDGGCGGHRLACDTRDVELRESPAGRRVSDWLDVLGRGELEELRRFASESCTDEELSRHSAEERARREAVVLYGDTMGLDVERVERVTSEEVVLATRARLTGELLRV